jgi:hypothetical protein
VTRAGGLECAVGDRNQVIFLQKHLPAVSGPILEVGSKDYGSTATFRHIFPNCPYVGVDIEEGKGVDAVVDLSAGIGALRADHFALVVCCSVLEHVAKPWLMAANITKVTAPKGKLFVSVPWVWRYHPYPDDYFRFSYRGIISLFPDFDWDMAYYSTNVDGEFVPISDTDRQVDDRMAKMIPTQGGGSRKYLPYLMVNMIGVRRPSCG